MHGSLLLYLDSEKGASKVLAHAGLLLRLSRRFESIVPSGLGQSSRVVNYKSGKIVIHADNGAAAAKLRQMSQRLCTLLSAEGEVQCNDMEIKVQPRVFSCPHGPDKPPPLSAPARAVLEDRLRSLPGGSPLRAALQKLLDHAL